MIVTCGAITAEDLVSYWAHDLDPSDVDRLDEHLMSCATCTEASARISVVAGAMRTVINPFINRATLESLRARGYRIRENVIRAPERKLAVFNANIDLLIHKLSGLDLTTATNVGVTFSVEETGQALINEPSVPFDRDADEILIACQTHFASLPPNVVVEVRVRDATGTETSTRFSIPHFFEPRAPA